MFIFSILCLHNSVIAVDSSSLLVKNGESHLDKWQVIEASQLSDKALELAKNNSDKGIASYLKSRVEFYKGNYTLAAKYGKEANTLLPNDKEISEFLDYISKVANTGEKFDEVRTTHFIIRYSHQRDSILPVYAEKALEKAYYEIGKDLGIYPSETVIVEVFPDPDSFAIASTLSQEKRWKEKKGPFINPFYETLIARALKENSLVPIEKMHPSFGKLSSAYEAQLAFAQVGTIVDFLVKKWGDNSLLDLLEYLRIKDNHEAAIRNLTGMNFAEFYNSWKKDLRSRNLKERIPRVKVSELRFEKDGVKSKEQSNDLKDLESIRAREFTRIGDMLKSRGRLKAAIYEYDQASKVDPISPIIVNRLASTHGALGEYSKAEESLSNSIEFYPEFVDTYINLGRIYLQKGNFKKAEEAYNTAISINPFDPEIHQSLITIYEKLGLPDSVESEKRVLSVLIKEE